MSKQILSRLNLLYFHFPSARINCLVKIFDSYTVRIGGRGVD